MPVARFGEWKPDLAAYGNVGVTVALNVLPAASGGGYVPFPSLVDANIPLPGAPLGGIVAETAGGIVYTYMGTRTAIYALSGQGWLNVSRAGGYDLGEEDRWEFEQAGNKIIAVCGGTAPAQVNDIGGPRFGPLVTTSDRKPTAVHIGSIRGWPILLHTFDAQDGEQPSRLWWPRLIQVLDITDWDPDLNTFAGYSGDYPQSSDGAGLKIIDGEVGYVFCKRAIYRMRYIGNGAEIFEVDRVVRGRGPICAGAIADDGRVTYFISEDGFYAFDGEEATPIGHGKIDETFHKRINRSATLTIVSAVIPELSVVLWSVPFDGASSPNRIIAYSIKEGRFSIADVAAADIRETALPGVSWDDEPWASRPLDASPWAEYIWDSTEFMGGTRVLTAIQTDGTVYYLSGAGLPATIETEEVSPNEPKVTEITEVRPVVDAASAGTTITVGSRMSIGDPVVWGQETPLNRIGYAPVRERGIYLRARIKIPAGFRQAIGVSFVPMPGGRA